MKNPKTVVNGYAIILAKNSLFLSLPSSTGKKKESRLILIAYFIFKSFKNRMLAAKHQKLFASNFLHSVKNLLCDCYANVKSLGAIPSF